MRVAEARGGEILNEKRVHTPAQPRDGVEEFSALAKGFSAPIESVAGGFAGIISADGAIETATNLPEWNGYPFAHALAETLGTEVRIVNDAEVECLGEALLGAGKGYRRVAYIGLGTGIGTALVDGGTIVPHSSDGDARSHIITLSDSTSFEERAGGRSLERRFGVSPKELPSEVWEELTPHFADMLRNALSSWSPDIIVVGGSLVNDEHGFSLEKAIALAGRPEIPIRHAALGDASGLYGASLLQ